MGPPKIRQVIQQLEKEGWEQTRCKGGRRIYRNGSKVVTIHGADNHTLTIGTWNAIQKQAGWK